MQVKPSDWDVGTRIRVRNLFGRTPARLKFLRGDRAELMSVLDVVKRLAMARKDVGFVLNNKWRFPKNQDLLERIAAVMGDEARGRMLDVFAESLSNSGLKITGYISEPTLRRASSVDQYLFVNGRPVKDKVLVGALRAAYMDVMHAREFPLCALYLTLDSHAVDVNVSPAKTEVHFLEPSHIRAFIIKTLRSRLAQTMVSVQSQPVAVVDTKPHVVDKVFFKPQVSTPARFDFGLVPGAFRVASKSATDVDLPQKQCVQDDFKVPELVVENQLPLGRVVGQIDNKYIIAQTADAMVVVDQHAAHERITYENLRKHLVKSQPLLTPIVVNMREEDVVAVLSVADEMRVSGVHVDAFGDDAIAVFEKPADWDLDWEKLMKSVADEVRANGHSSELAEKLHLKLANYACHHSVRAGQKLDFNQMDKLLRDIENTERAGQCNHGRPVYKIISFAEIDAWFER